MNPVLKLSQLAQDAGGHLEGADVAIAGVSTDTRSIKPGDVYFCLRGERFDGHDYAQAALEKGAAAIVVETPVGCDATQLIVPDCRVAFGLLARLWRRSMSAIVIGVTGSNGKTTVKQMLASVCGAACVNKDDVHYTRANDNNEGLGGHISSFSSSATLYDVGFNYFFRGSDGDHPGDLVFYQGHSAPGM